MKTYDLDTYVLPIWEGDTVFYETAMFLGETGECKLLYAPTKILGVYDYGLQKEYVEGVDFVLEGNVIKRLQGGSMPYANFEDIYAALPGQYEIAVEKSRCPDYVAGREYMTYGETDTYTKKQFAISYTHDDKWAGKVPQGKGERFPNTIKFLSKEKRLNVVFYGDSITTGCNSSGTDLGGNVPPYADSFPVMIQKKLQNIYEATVGVRNVAVGGWATVNGLDAFNERVLAEHADLMVLAYGMNDRGTPLDKYKEMIADMVCRFKKFNPDGEVVLVAPMLPNVETDWLKNQPLFAEKLYELEKEYPFVAVADMTQMHWDILSTGKRYRDMTGNNINHPNDFIARVYAQVILKTLLG